MKKKILLEKLESHAAKIAVIGLGYVGLPLAVSFSKKYHVIGFDIDQSKIQDLKNGLDITKELTDPRADLFHKNISFTSLIENIYGCEVILIAVPTPVDNGNKPDLRALLSASEIAGHIVKKSNEKVYVCYESTVYPGCTEEDCKPIIEAVSGKNHGSDFFLGYSPERINPGDKEHRFESITKVVSGCCEDSKNIFSKLYSSVISAGVYEAHSIKVAEAAKVIENTQRDINIALVNEIAVVFSRMGIDTQDVLAAAETKWNFMKFKPGLVGGHCIGVDPYYLTHKAEVLGYIPKVILSGRAINDSMGNFIALQTIKMMLKNTQKNSTNYKVLILGFTFKENIPDIRNTKVIDIKNTLEEFNCSVEVVDPVCSESDVQHEYGFSLFSTPLDSYSSYDAIILAVSHKQFENWILDIISNINSTYSQTVLVDIKGILSENKRINLGKNVSYWRL